MKSVHEQSKDLEHMVDEVVRAGLATLVLDFEGDNLGDDRAKLAGSSRDTVRGGAVARRERLARDNEGGRVRAEVLITPVSYRAG